MSDTLILMRHGKAQRPSDDLLDMERKLTEAGKRSLSATLPYSLGLLSAKGTSVQVWSSPAARAEQTARIMMKACKRHGADVASDLVLVDALWSQDVDAFLQMVGSCESDVVVAVGHNPFIEEVTAKLTGSHIDFATGGFAAIDMSKETASGDNASYPGRLLWFAQGPVSQRWRTVVHMERVLGDAADAVSERLEAFFAQPDDIETMHKFRVSIRTLRSLLAFVAPWQDASQNKSVQEDLKQIVSETSRLRELDVLTEQANAMEGSTLELVAFCANEAAKERERVTKTLSSKRTSKRLERLSSELHDVKWRKYVNASGLEESDVRLRFDELAASLREDLAALDMSDVEKTHDVRKSAKRVRYDAEKFKTLIGDDAVGIAKDMTAHQDNLGAICDARVNIDIINGFDIASLPDVVAWDLALLRAQNETFLYTTLRNA
ncbi:MAG: CHAD domain-containing protein [Eggerthellaceae bacterium]|nr:CHAD domain-containing protein [Eggerthellaceae bacterium]